MKKSYGEITSAHETPVVCSVEKKEIQEEATKGYEKEACNEYERSTMNRC